MKLKMRDHTPLREVVHTLFSVYRQRSMVGLALMIAQAFFYNAIFFTFALILTDFYGIGGESGRLVSAAVRGWQFFWGLYCWAGCSTRWDARVMIALTYGVSGVLLALSGYLFSIGVLSAQTQTIAWMVIFFWASPAASAAYLTVSETFRWEVRALAIAFFYAVGTGIGGVAGPALFWRVDRHGIARQCFLWLFAGGGIDDRGGCCRMALRHRGGAADAGICRKAAGFCGVG